MEYATTGNARDARPSASPRDINRLFDETHWPGSPLGPVADWEPALRNAVTLTLESGFPMCVYAGAELLLIYNAGFAEILRDKHPQAFGRPTRDAWSEIWDSLGPELEGVMAGSGATWHEDLCFLLDRGRTPQEAYFTYAFSPVTTADGRVVAVHATCAETTNRVLAERTLHVRTAELAQRAAELQRSTELLTESGIRAEAERARAEAARARSDANLEAMGDAYFMLDANFRICAVNAAMERGSGMARADLLNQDFWTLFPGALGTTFETSYRNATTKGVASHFTHDYSDGRLERIVEVDAVPVGGGGVAVFWRDTTDRARAEAQRAEAHTALERMNEQLADSAIQMELANQQLQDNATELEMQAEELRVSNEALEERTASAERAQREANLARRQLEDTFSQAPVAVAVLQGPRFIFTLANDNYTAITDNRPLIGRTVRDAFPELEGQGIYELLESVYSSGEPAVITEAPLMLRATPDSAPRERYINFTYQPMRASDGSVAGITVVATDVTEQVAAREVVAESARQFNTLVDTIPILAWTAKPDGFIDWYNARWYEYTGTTPESMAGWGWQSVHDPDELDRVLDTWREGIAKGEPVELTFPLRGADGVFRRFLTRITPVRDAEGRVLRWFGTNTDVESEHAAREHAERAAERTAQLQALTTVLGGVRTPDAVGRIIEEEAPSLITLRSAELICPGGDRRGVDAHVSAAIESGVAVFISSRQGPGGLLARYPDFGMLPANADIESLAVLPLAIGADAAGALVLTYRDAQTFAEDDRTLLKAFAREVSLTLERTRLFESEHTALAALRDSDARLHFAMDVARLGAWEVDVDTGNAWRSQRHDQIFGYDAPLPTWTVETLMEHVLPEDRDLVRDRYAAAVRDRTTLDFSCRIMRADGASRWIAARAEPTVDDAGRVIRLVGVVRDITAEKDAEQALRNAKELSEAANKSKSDFLAAMSHELRTPLNAIGGYAQLIDLGVHGPVTDAQHEALGRIQRSEEHLLSLINDVLNFAKIEAGRVEYLIAELDVEETLAQVAPLVEPQLASAELTLSSSVAQPLAVLADPDRLQQVLLNLYSNAIKFTPAGGTITVRAAPPLEGVGTLVQISVTDTGIGIPADRLESIFDPFVQVHRKLTRNTDGTGLGLSISRDLTRAMGGDLTVQSEVGTGSTFTLTIPSAPRTQEGDA